MVRKTHIALCISLQAIQATAATVDLSESDFLSTPPIVLTASRMAQSVMDAPNAVTVIDRETIVGSGYTRVTDLFRLVPGMTVGIEYGWNQIVTHSFEDAFARRMQVMVDGRSVYQPTFGGVRWDTLALAVDDIERIEVVRGPNAASYGDNAFTGIINIITRHPADVTGRLLDLVIGDHGQREAWFRWAGGSDQAQQRLTLGRREDNGLSNEHDDERSNILSYRGDFRPDGRQSISLQFGLVDGDRQHGISLLSPYPAIQQSVTSLDFQIDYKRQIDDDHDLTAKVYDNRLKTGDFVPNYPADQSHQTLNGERRHIEVQLDSHHGPALRSSMGGYLRQDSVNSAYYFNTGSDLKVNSSGLFGQVEWRFAPQWLLNGGAFFEHYSLVGDKTSPRLTLSFQPTENHSLRFGISRAYRNPVLYEESGYIRDYHFPGLSLPIGDPNLKPESLLSREIGYLGRWPELHLNVDLRVFKEHFNDYIGYFFNIQKLGNWGSAEQSGFEGQLKWQPQPHTQVIANYAEFHIDSAVTNNDTVGQSAPRQSTGLHLMHRLPGKVDINLSQYWVSSSSPIGHSTVTPGYRKLDCGVRKHFTLGGLPATAGVFLQNMEGSYYGLYLKQEQIVDRRAMARFQLEF